MVIFLTALVAANIRLNFGNQTNFQYFFNHFVKKCSQKRNIS